MSAAATTSQPSTWASVRDALVGPFFSVYNLFLFAVLRRPPYYPNDTFPVTAELEANWKVIRSELDDLLDHGPEVPPFVVVDPGQRKLWTLVGTLLGPFIPKMHHEQLKLDSWRTFVFYTYGLEVPPNTALCPQTAAMLRDVPGLVGAMFSVLEPGARLPTHLGLFPGALRIHLGLRVPPGDKTGMRVAGIERHWKEGEVFVFEHTRLHTAWNDADEDRVVLILDIERPMPWRWLERLNHRLVGSLRYWPRTKEAVAHIEQLAAQGGPYLP